MTAPEPLPLTGEAVRAGAWTVTGGPDCQCDGDNEICDPCLDTARDVLTAAIPHLAVPDVEPRYTLAEARQVIAREECQRGGHEYTEIRSCDGQTETWCGRCNARFTEVTPDE